MLLKLTKTTTIIIVMLFVAIFAVSLFNKDESTSETQSTTENKMQELIMPDAVQATDETTTAATNALSDETYIILDNENTTISGNGASFENGVLTISDGGSYNIKGVLDDGKILVNCPDAKKAVKLILDGAYINSLTDSPLLIENSPKETVIVLKKGSENAVSYECSDNIIDKNTHFASAAVYSKGNLKIAGEGTLSVNAKFSKGIVSHKAIVVKENITLNVTSVNEGIRAKQQLTVSGGNVNVTSNANAFASGGNITVSGGRITVVTSGGATDKNKGADKNAILLIGKERNADVNDIFDFFSENGKMTFDSEFFETIKEKTTSAMGMKAENEIILSSGNIEINSVDDCIHAQKVTVSGGTCSFRSDADAIFALESATVSGGEINVINSLSGIESKSINILGGNVVVKANNNGLNATDSRFFTSTYSQCDINISGGYVHSDSLGYGVNADGNITMTDGTLIVFGSEKQSSIALKCGGSFSMNEGTFLALGNKSIKNSVINTGDVSVLELNFSQNANQLLVITEKGDEDEALIAFSNTKAYKNVVFASDEIDEDEKYLAYQGGSLSGRVYNGVYTESDYVPGTLVGSLS